jgi:hypothetical protein
MFLRLGALVVAMTMSVVAQENAALDLFEK